jgi:hypothetical protein
MLVSIIAIMKLQYVGIYRGLVCLFLLPFDFLMEQSYCSELVAVMVHIVYFHISWSGFLYIMALSTFRVSASGFVMCMSDCNFNIAACTLGWACHRIVKSLIRNLVRMETNA